MPKISISYRRADSEAMTGRICDRLIGYYSKEAIFRDIDDIPAGIDFRQHINEVLLKTNVLLAIVGPKWLGTSRGGLERINEESDPVRVEVETALRRRVPIIPVLIGNTRMPGSDQLPPSLKDFAFRNAVKVDTGRDFDHHIDRLIKSIDAILSQTPKSSPPSRETAIPGVQAKPSAKAERPTPTTLGEPPRKKDTGPRPAAATPTPPPGSAPRKLQLPGLTALPRDWRETLWPANRQGRRVRLAAAAAIAVALLAFLAIDILPGGPGGDGARRVLSLANSGPVRALAFSPDARMIASASLDKSVNLWDVVDGRLLGTMHDTDGVSSIAFMPNGKEIVSGDLNGMILIRNAGIGERTVRSLKPDVTFAWEFLPAVWSVAVSPQGVRIASGSADGSVKIWSASGELLSTLKGHTDVVTAIAFAPNGRTIVSGSKDGTVRIWDVYTGEGIASLTDHPGQVFSVAISPDGGWIAAGGSGSTALIWNAANGRVVHTLISKLNPVESVAFSHDGKQLALGGDGGLIELWNADTAERLQTLTGNSRSVRALAYSPDGSRLAAGGDDKTIDIWSTD